MAEIRAIWLHAHHMIRSARQIINENLHSLNISSAEGNILLHLLTQAEGLGQEQLVEQLDISKPAVSRALHSLETKGFITRRQDSQDRRMQQVWLTTQAHQIGPDIEQAYNRLYGLAVEGISEEELDGFVRLFGRISENFTHAHVRKITEEENAG